MMTKIKHALAFLFGALYALAIVGLCCLPNTGVDGVTPTPLYFISVLVVILGGIGIIISIIGFLDENWNRND